MLTQAPDAYIAARGQPSCKLSWRKMAPYRRHTMLLLRTQADARPLAELALGKYASNIFQQDAAYSTQCELRQVSASCSLRALASTLAYALAAPCSTFLCRL